MSMTTVGYAALQVVPSIKDIKANLTKSVTEPMTEEGEKAGDGFGGAFNKKMLAVVAVGAAAVGGLFKIGDEFDAITDNIIIGTGAAGDVLAGLTQSARNIGTTVPSSFDDIGQAVADLNTRMDLTGPQLETMAGKLLNLSRISKTDVSTNIANVSRVFGDWNIATGDQALTLDKLFAATQQTGIGLDRLSTLTVQYGAPLRQMGFSLDEAVAMFGKFEKEGVNTETVMAGMKMGLSNMARAGEEPVDTFKRVVEQIKAAGSAGEANGIALELFGSRAGPDMAAAIREGRFELDDLVATIAGSGGALDDAVTRTGDFSESWQLFKNKAMLQIEPIAVRVFDIFTQGMEWMNSKGIPVLKGMVDWGQRNVGWLKPTAIAVLALVAAWRVGVVVAAAYKSTVAAITAVKAALNSQIALTLRRYAALAVAKLKDMILTGRIMALYIADAIKSAAATAASTAAMLAQRAAMLAVRAAMAIATAAQWAYNAALSANPIGLIILAVVALVAAIVWLWNNNEGFKNFIMAAWEAIKNAVMVVVDWFQQYVVPVLSAIWDGIVTYVQFVADVYRTVWDAIWAAVSAVVDWFQNTMVPILTAVWDGIVAYIQMVAEVYRTVWDAIYNVVATVVDWLVNTAWPWLRDMWQSFIDKVTTVWEAVRDAFTSVVDFVKGIPEKLKAILIGAATVLVERGKEFITGLWDGIKAKAEDVWTWFTDLGGKISGYFTAAKDLLVQAGKDIIEGLLSGITSGFEKVKDFVGGIGSWISDNKGPKAYDLALLVPAGGWIMDGLRHGLEAQIPALRDTLGRIGDTIGLEGALAGTAGLQVGGGSSSTVKTLNYYAAPGGTQVSGGDELSRAMNSARMVGW